jgi:membrane protease YdiL (CAAX protease family)
MDKNNIKNTSLKKQLSLYFGGILIVYIIALALFWPRNGGKPNDTIFLFIMFAPTIGALIAKFFGKAKIVFGRPSKWIFAAFIPTVLVLIVYFIVNSFGWISLDSKVLVKTLSFSMVSIFVAMLSAIGEEIGWRGFMWPALRKEHTFIYSSIFTLIAWWIYHVPVIILGWYGSLGGLPAFTVAIIGAVLFIGVITDRSKSIWPSVVFHGAWNALVASSFAYTLGAEKLNAFSGNVALLGEFGWLAAVSMFILGVASAIWHIKTLKLDKEQA